MKALLLSLLVSAFSLSAFAGRGNTDIGSSEIQKACGRKLTKELKTEARKAQWSFEGLSSLNPKQAKTYIQDALAEDEAADQELMLRLLNDDAALFYALSWSAPANEGLSIIAVDKKTCKQIVDVLFNSTE